MPGQSWCEWHLELRGKLPHVDVQAGGRAGGDARGPGVPPAQLSLDWDVFVLSVIRATAVKN